MNKVELYKATKKSSWILLFETRENALQAANDIVINCKGAVYAFCSNLSIVSGRKNFLKQKYNINIGIASPGDIIFAISKEKYGKYGLWHCIIGEKCGWIIFSKEMELIKLIYDK
jgi:hypothetical protein